MVPAPWALVTFFFRAGHNNLRVRTIWPSSRTWPIDQGSHRQIHGFADNDRFTCPQYRQHREQALKVVARRPLIRRLTRMV